MCFAVGHLGVVACEPAVHSVNLVLGAPEAVVASYSFADCQRSDEGQSQKHDCEPCRHFLNCVIALGRIDGRSQSETTNTGVLWRILFHLNSFPQGQTARVSARLELRYPCKCHSVV